MERRARHGGRLGCMGIAVGLLPELLLDIFRRLETTAIITRACACKPSRRAIISNASSLRPCPDRFNPNLLVGFFHDSWDDAVDKCPPRVIVSMTAVDTGHCQRLSSLIPADSAAGVDLSSSHHHRILSSRDGLLLLLLRRHGSKHDELCLCNPMARDCRFLPLAPIMEEEEEYEYTLITGHEYDHGAVRILAKAGTTHELCTEEDRLVYQVFSCGGDDGAGIWGPVQRSDEVDKGRRMFKYGSNAVVARDAVYWLAGPRLSGWRITCAVGLDIYTGQAWATELPDQCQFFYTSTTAYALTTSANGRLSLLQPLPDHHIQIWVLDGDRDAMDWIVQHKISIDVQNQPGDAILRYHYLNVVCPRSGFLFIMLFSGLQLRINVDSRARQPVQCIGKRSRYGYYPYEMDWSTYISNMKNF